MDIKTNKKISGNIITSRTRAVISKRFLLTSSEPIEVNNSDMAYCF